MSEQAGDDNPKTDFLLQDRRQNLDPLAKLRRRLDLALVFEPCLVAADDFANRSARHRQRAHDLFDRAMFLKIRAPDRPDHVHADYNLPRDQALGRAPPWTRPRLAQTGRFGTCFARSKSLTPNSWPASQPGKGRQLSCFQNLCCGEVNLAGRVPCVVCALHPQPYIRPIVERFA